MKSRNELVNEIVKDFEDKLLNEWVNQIDLNDILKARDFLRTSLLRISNASMDAVEVEEVRDKGEVKMTMHDGSTASYEVDSDRALFFNSAIAASKEKRRLFTIDSKNSG